jgi:hypothetical protein
MAKLTCWSRYERQGWVVEMETSSALGTRYKARKGDSVTWWHTSLRKLGNAIKRGATLREPVPKTPTADTTLVTEGRKP